MTLKFIGKAEDGAHIHLFYRNELGVKGRISAYDWASFTIGLGLLIPDLPKMTFEQYQSLPLKEAPEAQKSNIVAP